MAKVHNDEFRREAVRMVRTMEKHLTKRSEKSYNQSTNCPVQSMTLHCQ